MINEQTFDQIWDVIKDKYDVKDWETCSMRTLDRAERLSIKMRDAFRLIEGIALSELEKENK
jgi:hypothetical protein